MRIIKRLIIDNEDGIILFSVLMLSIVFLSLGLAMLYQSDTNFKMSALTRDRVEVFMTTETAYEAAVSRMIFLMENSGYADTLRTAWPGDATGWPNYLVRVYDNPNNPTKFRLVTQPSTDFWINDSLNRDLTGQQDVTDDSTNTDYFLITRQDSVSAANVFQIEDAAYAGSASAYHFYRAWFEADRHLDTSPEDRTVFLMVEGFRGNPNTPIDPHNPSYIPLTRVLMQYRVRMSKSTMGWESEDDSGSFASGRAGTGSSVSGGVIDITSGGSGSREISTGGS